MYKQKNCGNMAAWANFVVIALPLNVTLKSRKKFYKIHWPKETIKGKDQQNCPTYFWQYT